VDWRIAAPTNTGILPCSVVHPRRCMRAISVVAMFHVEPSRVGRDGRLPAKRGQPRSPKERNKAAVRGVVAWRRWTHTNEHPVMDLGHVESESVVSGDLSA